MAQPTLKKGSKGQAVKDLQEALNALGFSVGAVDGVFGAATERAVREFQASVGIDVDGVVGRVTWLNINEADQSEPVLRNGSKGLPVRRLQHRMSLAGFDTGGVDGRFGARTEQAVRKLQEQSGLAVDGIVGPDTWAVVNALGASGTASARRAGGAVRRPQRRKLRALRLRNLRHSRRPAGIPPPWGASRRATT